MHEIYSDFILILILFLWTWFHDNQWSKWIHEIEDIYSKMRQIIVQMLIATWKH